MAGSRGVKRPSLPKSVTKMHQAVVVMHKKRLGHFPMTSAPLALVFRQHRPKGGIYLAQIVQGGQENQSLTLGFGQSEGRDQLLGNRCHIQHVINRRMAYVVTGARTLAGPSSDDISQNRIASPEMSLK